MTSIPFAGTGGDFYDALGRVVDDVRQRDIISAEEMESEPLLAFDKLRLALETDKGLQNALFVEMVEEAKKIVRVKTFHALFIAIQPLAECQYAVLDINKGFFHKGPAARRGAMIITTLHSLRKVEVLRDGRFKGCYLTVCIVQDRGSNVLALGISKTNPHQ